MMAFRVIAGTLLMCSGVLMWPDAVNPRHPVKLRVVIGLAASLLTGFGVAILAGGAP